MIWPKPKEATGGRVEVVNPSDGGFWYWLLKFYAFAALAAGGLVVTGLTITYVYFAASVPRTPVLSENQIEAAQTSTLRGWDGTPLAEWAKEHRAFAPAFEIPDTVVDAFLAVEDRRFFQHGGIDYRGIMRAAAANFRAGGVSQGGSTITQQVAKSFLSPERTMARKIREAILSRRIESRNSKRAILSYYLNQIYLGRGPTAYGRRLAVISINL